MSWLDIFHEKLRINDLQGLNKLLKDLDPRIPYLGLEVVKVNYGYVIATFPVKKDLIRIGNILHGGAIMTAIDMVSSIVVL